MAYVPVPKDLSKIKTKLAFNLTKRQLVCFSSAAAVGLPAYLFSRGSIGNSAAMFLMIYALLSARKEAQPIAKQQKGRKARRQKA